MKKLAVILMLLLMPLTAYAVQPDVLAESADPSDTTIDTTGNTTMHGGSALYKELTCFFSGTAGTFNADIDGSLDGSTFYGMYDDITALGGYSVVNQPFIYYRVGIDTCTNCALTIKCIPVNYDASGR
jgi:hypothetical protein